MYDILENIELGVKNNSKKMIQYLCVEGVSTRCEVNKLFAEAYSKSGKYEDKKLAYNFIKRAFWLSNYNEEYINTFVKIAAELGEFAEIKKAYKSVGMKYCNSGNIEKALDYYNKWQHTYSIHANIDRYEYDLEILTQIQNAAKKYIVHTDTNNKNNDKTVVAYLLRGIKDSNATYYKILRQFAKHYNKDLFEIFFFVPETEAEILNSNDGKKHFEELKKLNCKLITAPENDDKISSYIQLANLVSNENPDVIVTTAVLQDLQLYFISSLLPNIKKISFIHGALPLFAPLDFDWSISQTKHPIMESPNGCSFVDLEFDLTNKESIQTINKESLGIPENSQILLGIGRHTKFQDKDYWNAVKNVLINTDNSFLMLIGPTKDSIPFLNSLIGNDLVSRVRFLGWVEDYLNILAIADVVIDTYPFGGGIVILEALALGIPVVSFENYYLQEYDQTNWSLADMYISENFLIAQRNNFVQFEQTIIKLLKDNNYRNSIGNKCKEYVWNRFGNPKRMVYRAEQTYLKVLNKKYDANEIELFENEVNNYLMESKMAALERENFNNWQKAYAEGYNSSMGDHKRWFYNKYIEALGFYNKISTAKNIIEYAPGNGEFIKNFVQTYPNKNFYLLDISEKNLESLKQKFSPRNNVKYFLNYPETYELMNVDLAFSFLLCQSVPISLWKKHLKSVQSMLVKGGSYYFQFAFNPNGIHNDSIQDALNGSNVYEPNEIFNMLEEAGFDGADLTVPITLEELKSDSIWYICKAYK